MNFLSLEKKDAEALWDNLWDHQKDALENMNKYITSDGKHPLKISDTCLDVKDDAFKLKANGKNFKVNIKFDINKYKLTCTELDEYYDISSGLVIEETFTKYFNRTQSFRILPENTDVIYFRGQFYSPKLKIGKYFDPNTYYLGQCFEVDNEIGNCKSEKGNTAYYKENDDKWDSNSLFGIIFNRSTSDTKLELFGSPNIIVCDDMNYEIADFILCETEPKNERVIFVHAKAYRGTKNSTCATGQLHEVCAQAIKNLGYLTRFNNNEPKNLNLWDGSWESNKKTGKRMVKKRIHSRDATDDAEKTWNKIKNVINNPQSNKEVWLFLGNIISKQYFESQLKNEDPQANVIQAAYLVQATISDISSVGAKPRIFCKE
ncbi:MAG: hypothetical protein JW891_02470 [Candidatus Lokiarchaeota archaeon]|nr:hypothetical protein [Candidatus Lokiarchaeota archaeon]